MFRGGNGVFSPCRHTPGARVRWALSRNYLCLRSFPTSHSRKSAEQTLLPPSVALLHRKDSHERFHSVDFSVVDLKRFPHRELVTAALAHAPSHAQPDDAHALIDRHDARLHVAEAIEDGERLCRDILAAGGKLAVGTCHHLAVFVAIGIRCKWRV